jgi:uncharacterized membrane protein
MSHNHGSLDYLQAAARWFGRKPEEFGPAERRAVNRAARRLALAEDPIRKLDAEATPGERLADRVARFGGSWSFIILFIVSLIAWALFNTVLVRGKPLDPYPFIFLNLLLSMVAALQAPVIMMSQNRQAAKDRQMATHDYEVNLKAEIEIMALHEKLDTMRADQLAQLLAKQQQQIDLLTRLVAKMGAGNPTAEQ